MSRALSIRQPWAWLIVHGYKDVENRDWPTRVRGRVLVHAGKKLDREGYNWLRLYHPGIPLPMADQLECGGIVGEATVLDCVDDHDSPWFFGRYGFVLGNARPLPFHPMPGKLGFFDATDPQTEVAGDLRSLPQSHFQERDDLR